MIRIFNSLHFYACSLQFWFEPFLRQRTLLRKYLTISLTFNRTLIFYVNFELHGFFNKLVNTLTRFFVIQSFMFKHISLYILTIIWHSPFLKLIYNNNEPKIFEWLRVWKRKPIFMVIRDTNIYHIFFYCSWISWEKLANPICYRVSIIHERI